LRAVRLDSANKVRKYSLKFNFSAEATYKSDFAPLSLLKIIENKAASFDLHFQTQMAWLSGVHETTQFPFLWSSINSKIKGRRVKVIRKEMITENILDYQ
jgi:hypothetical protein